MPAGLTSAQMLRFAEYRCTAGHRFDGFNYPTPEGRCPSCVVPGLNAQIGFARAVAQLGSQPAEPPDLMQPVSAALIASSER